MTSPAYLNTPIRCVELAMKDAGLLPRNEMPDSDQLAEYGGRLLDLINLWQTQGLKLWLQSDTPMNLTSGVGTYNIFAGSSALDMTKPLRVLQAYTVNTAGTRRPLQVISRDEYSRLSNVTNTGAINSVFVDKQQTQLAVNLWLVPDDTAATDVVHLILQQQVTNFTNLTETINFPQEWFIALRWGLADDICGGQSQLIMARCAERAKAYREALEDWDVEDASTYFSPDSRGVGNGRSFR